MTTAITATKQGTCARSSKTARPAAAKKADTREDGWEEDARNALDRRAQQNGPGLRGHNDSCVFG